MHLFVYSFSTLFWEPYYGLISAWDPGNTRMNKAAAPHKHLSEKVTIKQRPEVMGWAMPILRCAHPLLTAQ